MESPVQTEGFARQAAELEFTGATTDIEQLLCDVLAGVLKVERVEPDDDFFQDLGADSMVMAQFCARVRKRGNLPSVSMKQVYANPTIRSLAAAVAEPLAASSVDAATFAARPPARVELPEAIATWRYVLCGSLQVLTASAYLGIALVVATRGYAWALAGSSFLDLYARVVLVTTAVLLGAIVLPILVKWSLVGRWQVQEIRIWSLAYFRFWVIKTLVQTNPLVLFVGTPLYVLYLRALGAKIGRNVLVMSPHVPPCTDLLTIGDNAVVRKDSYFLCYRAHAGRIQIGPVRLGKDTVVGEMTVLDIDTSLGDGAQIGHSSSLHSGQSIPAGEHRYGSPAEEKTDVSFASVEPTRCGPLRRTVFSLAALLPMILLLPAIIGVIARVVVWLSERQYFDEAVTFARFNVYQDALILSAVLFFGPLIAGLLFVATVPRLLNLALRADKVYPLYGFHYWAQMTIARVTNVPFFMELFGDSSYIVYYLRAIGYDLSKIVQTGSNFGTDVRHDNPFLVTIGSGTMAADGLSSINADYSSSSFRVSRVKIGADNYFGNHVAYPSQGKTGANCLLATKVMVPLDGEVREDTGLLGSPSFKIPRTVLRDRQLTQKVCGEKLRHRLRRKNRHNVTTIGLFLLSRWGDAFGMTLLGLAMIDQFQALGSVAIIALFPISALLLRVVYYALVERASTLFRPLEPRTCSIYDQYFWFHERFWKLMTQNAQLRPLDGTPLKGLFWRLSGIRIGRRVFDDGCWIVERTMVTIGDDCALNHGSIIQPHSQEDFGFKSDRITMGTGCTLGVGALVHYGVKMGNGSQLAPNAFLMKGEEVPPYARWGGNPARELGQSSTVEATYAIASLSRAPSIDPKAMPMQWERNA